MLAALLATALAAAAPTTATLEQVAAALHRSPAWHAEFTQRYVPAGFETGASDAGRLTVAFPAKLRFDYAGPAARVFATDGTIARDVDTAAASCTAVRLDAGAWGRLPLTAVLDPGAARSTFAVTAVGRTLTLTAREPNPELAAIEIVVAGDGLPARVTVVDESGDRNEFEFSAWAPVAEPALEYFRPALAGEKPCQPEE
jgi:outer membrane lipoprotein-sorting protein